MSIAKVAVLVAGLAVAMMAVTVHPAPAQAYPTYGTGCTGCHTAGGSVTATPSAASVAPGGAYTVALAYTGGTVGSTKVGYAITGNGANVTAMDAGPASMAAPAAVGSYTYTVWMRTGVVATTTYTITVAAAPVVVAPVASFTTSVASGTFPLPVTMTDTSTNAPTSWAWSMGDGTTSTLRNPSVTYATAGTKTVTLVATNAGGASTMVSKTITVTAPVVIPPAPVASFTASALSGVAPLAVTFADTSTGAPTSWLWTFGNGSTSNLQNPAAVTYTTAGTYTVKLIASNANGASTPVSKTITVTATVPTPSAAHISWMSTDEAGVGTSVTIKGTGFGTAGVVKFGTVVATASSWTDTTIVVLVPGGITSEEVDVTVTPTGGSASNGVEFEVKSNQDGYEHHSVQLDESFS